MFFNMYQVISLSRDLIVVISLLLVVSCGGTPTDSSISTQSTGTSPTQNTSKTVTGTSQTNTTVSSQSDNRADPKVTTPQGKSQVVSSNDSSAKPNSLSSKNRQDTTSSKVSNKKTSTPTQAKPKQSSTTSNSNSPNRQTTKNSLGDKQTTKSQSKVDPLPAQYYEWNKGEIHEGKYYNRCKFWEGGNKGLMIDELFFMREIILRNYIFRNEVVDLNPHNFVKASTNFDDHYNNMTDENSYLQQLRSFVKRADGSLRHGPFIVSKNRGDFPNYRLLRSRHLGIDWEKSPGRFDYGYPLQWKGSSNSHYLPLDHSVPREYTVRYLQTNSPASELLNGKPKVKRGDKLIEVNDLGFKTLTGKESIDRISNALDPAESGVETKLVLLDRDSKKEKTVVISSRDAFKTTPAFGSELLKIDNEVIGYIHLGRGLYNFEHVHPWLKEFKKNKVSDVILDIRYYDEVERRDYVSKFEPLLLASILKNSLTKGKIFRYREGYGYDHKRKHYPKEVEFRTVCHTLEWSSKEKGICDENANTSYVPQISPKWWPDHNFNGHMKGLQLELPSLELDRIFLLTSKNTCGVGELIINSLLGIDVEVILIGEETCGSPYQSVLHQNCGITFGYFGAEYMNHKREGRYDFGFKPKNSKSKYGVSIPGCYVVDDFSKDLGNKDEAMLSAALQYRKNKTCPEIP